MISFLNWWLNLPLVIALPVILLTGIFLARSGIYFYLYFFRGVRIGTWRTFLVHVAYLAAAAILPTIGSTRLPILIGLSRPIMLVSGSLFMFGWDINHGFYRRLSDEALARVMASHLEKRLIDSYDKG